MQQTKEIQYVMIAPSDWHRIKDNVMRLWHEFFGGTCLLEDEKTTEELFENSESIAFAAYHGTLDHLVGFSLAITSSYFKKNFGKYYVNEDGSLLYYYDMIGVHDMHGDLIAVDKAMQNRGIGMKLLNLMMKEAADRNYESVTMHAKKGPSSRMIEKLNPQFSGECPDFFGTGDDYIFYKLRIH